ncbi:MAG: hypothetical protein KF683_16500 [Rubrivivax sp.]|nr:hypothetical protein [Rubrivivax sp.]
MPEALRAPGFMLGNTALLDGVVWLAGGLRRWPWRLARTGRAALGEDGARSWAWTWRGCVRR